VSKRVFVLLLLLFLSFVISFLFLFFMSFKGQILFAGNVNKTMQTGNKCIIEIDMFIVSESGKCRSLLNRKVMVVGTTYPRLINTLSGKIELVDAKIDFLEADDVKQEKQSSLLAFLERVLLFGTNLYKAYLPYRESSLLSGIVFGQKQDIGYEFYSQMVKSGSIHIAVASGFNLMLLGGFVMHPLFYFWRRAWSGLVAIALLFVYALLTGFEPPVVRAWLMISLLFASLALGRKQPGWWVLLVSVWIVLVWDIWMIWNVSFQLSVAASIGLIVLVPMVVKWGSEKGYESEVNFLEKSGFLGTLMAMALTVPIIWYHFGRVSFIGLFSNLLILPLVPPVMVLGLFMLVFPSVFYLPTYALLHMIVVLIEFFGS